MTDSDILILQAAFFRLVGAGGYEHGEQFLELVRRSYGYQEAEKFRLVALDTAAMDMAKISVRCTIETDPKTHYELCRQRRKARKVVEALS